MIKTAASVLAIAFLAIVGFFVIGVIKSEGRTSSQLSPRGATALDKEKSAETTSELNRGLPTMLDSQTMLTRVDATQDSRTYHITMVNYPSEHLDSQFLAKYQELVGRRNCLDRDIRWTYEQDIYMKYVVSGSDNRVAGSFIISKIYCQRFG